MIKILLNHKWAVFFAVLIGLIMVFPQAYFRLDAQNAYQGIELHLTGADEEFYLTRIQEVRDGYFTASNAFWLEGKDLPYLSGFFSEMISALLGKLFGLSLNNTALFERFLFPAIIFLLIYSLVYGLVKKRLIALIASSSVLLAIDLIGFHNLQDLILNQKTSHSFLTFSHLISPQTNSLFFFGFLAFFWFFFEKKKAIYGIISAIILGLSVYTYPYTWTFLYAFLGILLVVLFFKKDWPWFKKVVWIMISGAAIAIPYFWNLWQAIQYPLYNELSLRFGLVKSHSPIIGSLIVILLALFLFSFNRFSGKARIFLLGLVLAPFIVLNQQIITGKLMIPAHYHWYYHKPLFIIILVIFVFSWLEYLIKSQRFRNVLLVGLCALILLVNFYNGIMVQINSYNYSYQRQNAVSDQSYASVFRWLNNQAEKNNVVMANFRISNLIPIYTSLNPITSLGGAHYSLVAEEKDLWQRMFLEYRLDGLKAEEAEERFFKDKIKIAGLVYGEHYRKGFGGQENIPDGKILAFTKAYKKSLNVSLEDILRKYQAKYVVWDTLTDPNWSIDKYSFLEQIYQKEGIKVYKLQ